MRKKTYNINFESRKQGHTMGKEFFTGKLFSKTSAIDWIPMVKVTYVPFFHFSFFFLSSNNTKFRFQSKKKDWTSISSTEGHRKCRCIHRIIVNRCPTAHVTVFVQIVKRPFKIWVVFKNNPCIIHKQKS